MIGIIYNLFALIDSIVYGLASSLFRIIFDLATTHFFDDKQIQPITTRIYIVVGVLMLFKLVISAVQYLINPESFDDKEKGLGGVLKKTAISMALIAVVPTIFQFLMAVQGPIIKTLPSVILGAAPSETVDDSSIGFDLSFQVLSTFVRAKPGKGGSVSDMAGKTQGQIHDFWSFQYYVSRGCPSFVLDFSGSDNCVYDYKVIISTICGGFLCYVLLTMVLDISIRTIKMGIIEMLAPIPISSYIISKDKFNKFVKTASSVYFDLFIRMGIIYFVIFAINAIVDTGVLGFGVFSGAADTGDAFRNIVVNIALIFGLLMFASKAPKFISELLGLPDVGSGDLADMFKPAWQRAGGAFGALANPIANAVGNARQAWGTNANMGSRLRRALNAARRGAAGFGKGALDSVEGVMAGDDWHKMHNRLNASKQRSLERAKTQQNRINNEPEYGKRKNAILSQIEKVKEKLELFGKKEEIEAKAREKYNAERDRLTKMGADIQKGIDDGTLKGEELTRALEKYKALSNKLSVGEEAYVKNEMKTVAAEIKQQKDIDDINAQIKEADKKIASATTTEEKLNAEIEKADLEQRLENITHEKELKQVGTETKDAYLKIKSDEKNILASEATIQTLTADRDAKSLAAQQEIDKINARLSDPKCIGDERLILQEQLNDITAKRDVELKDIEAKINQENDKIKTLNADKEATQKVYKAAQDKLVEIKKKKEAEFQEIVADYVATVDQSLTLSNTARDKDGNLIKPGQLELLEKEHELTQAAIRQSGWRSSLDSYFGGIPVSGKGYTDLSSLLGQTRSSIYTVEAMTKMRQNADILVDVNGQPLEFTTKFGSGKHSYEEMVKIKNMLDRSELTDEQLKDRFGFNNSAVFGSAFEDIEKKAAAAYITANIAMIDDDVRSNNNVRLKRPDLNSAVVETWNTFIGEIVKLGVPESEMNEIIREFKKNPGGFMSGASTLKDLYSSTGKSVIDVQKPSDGNK